MQKQCLAKHLKKLKIMALSLLQMWMFQLNKELYDA